RAVFYLFGIGKDGIDDLPCGEDLIQEDLHLCAIERRLERRTVKSALPAESESLRQSFFGVAEFSFEKVEFGEDLQATHEVGGVNRRDKHRFDCNECLPSKFQIALLQPRIHEIEQERDLHYLNEIGGVLSNVSPTAIEQQEGASILCLAGPKA